MDRRSFLATTSATVALVPLIEAPAIAQAAAGEAHSRPLLGAPFEDGQRHCAFLQDLMELANVEPRPEKLLGLGAGAKPGEMADLVAAGLARRYAIAVDLALQPGPRDAGRRDHIVERLLSAPAL